MANNGTDLASLHPAASVFRDVVMSGMNLGCDNERLTEDISRLQPLLNYAQTIVITAVTDDEPFRSVRTTTNHGDGTMTIETTQPTMEVISTLSLSQGTIVVKDDGEEELTHPIKSAPPILLENMGSEGGIRFRLANVVFTYPGGYNGKFSHSKVEISDDDTATLNITLSAYVSVQCQINGLTNEDIIAFREEQYDANRFDILHFLSRDHWDSIWGITITPNDHRMFDTVTVTPISITMKIGPSLKTTLGYINKASSPAEHFDTCVGDAPADQLVDSTVMALGDDCHKTLLRGRRVLQARQNAFLSLQESLQTVEIHYSRNPWKSLKFSLAHGRMKDFGEQSMRWHIYTKGDDVSFPVNNIGNSLLSLSTGLGGYECTIHGQMQIIGEDEERPSGLIYYYNCQPWSRDGIAVIGSFDWSDLSDEELEEVEDCFEAKLRSIFWGSEDSVFPKTFKVNIRRVILSLSLLGSWIDGLVSGEIIDLLLD